MPSPLPDTQPLRLPPVVYDDGLVQFASSLAVHWQAHSSPPLVLDLQDMQFYTPGAYRGFYQWNHAAQHEYPSELHLPAPYPGTFCAVQFTRSKLAEHQRLMGRISVFEK